MPLRRPSSAAALALAALALAACAEVTAPREPAAEVSAGVPGFDIGVYPGDAALRAWAAPASPYRWVGYYLPAPCHRDASFSGRRAAVASAGYGVAVLYVGQQTWDGVAAVQPADGGAVGSVRAERAPAEPGPAAARTARLWAQAQPEAGAATRAAAGAAVTCSRTLLSAARGASEGNDAVARTAAEGFAAGTAVYLDLEPMATIPPAMRDYYRAWARALLADGRYRPAVYVHHTNASAVYADLAAVFAAFPGAGVPRVWVARSAGFALTRAPADAGFAFATAWQGALDVVRTWAGVTLTVDENVADRASPSAP